MSLDYRGIARYLSTKLQGVVDIYCLRDRNQWKSALALQENFTYQKSMALMNDSLVHNSEALSQSTRSRLNNLRFSLFVPLRTSRSPSWRGLFSACGQRLKQMNEFSSEQLASFKKFSQLHSEIHISIDDDIVWFVYPFWTTTRWLSYNKA